MELGKTELVERLPKMNITDYKNLYEKELQNRRRLQSKVAELHTEISQKNMFVRWFVTEYGLESYGRKPEQMKKGLISVVNPFTWFRKKKDG